MTQLPAKSEALRDHRDSQRSSIAGLERSTAVTVLYSYQSITTTTLLPLLARFLGLLLLVFISALLLAEGVDSLLLQRLEL